MDAYSIKFDGRLLDRGFWLYVIDIHGPADRHLYVGRTGDSSSPNAASPFSRIGQHLDPRHGPRGTRSRVTFALLVLTHALAESR